MTGVLCDKKVPTRAKGKIYSTVVQPAMLYAMEVVPLSAKQEGQLEVAKMKRCRWTCGWTRRDRVRNERVRETLGVETIITARCRRSQLRWFRHIKRREGDYVGESVINMELPGRRRRGRPKRRWSDNIDGDLENIGAMREDAADREHWKRLTAAATPHQRGSS